MFKKKVLKNGLRIIAIPEKNALATTVLVLVGTGSKYEKKNINGVSHFLEHMFFKGTKKRPNTLAIAETLDRVGGSYNAFTGEEYTGYYAKTEASKFDLALDWVSDIFLHSKLESEEIEREKGVIIEEINMYLDNPMLHIQSLWRNLLYGDQPAGWDIAGTKETVSKMSRDNLASYMQSQYVAENTIVCAAGKINPENVFKKIERAFSEIKKSKFSEMAKTVESQNSPNCILNKKETDQTHICLGVRGFNIFHPLRYSQDILSVILGGMMSSRLWIKVRERMGLAYYINTDSGSDKDSGFVATQAGVDSKNVEKAIAAILEEYRFFSKNEVPKEELKKAKDYLKGKLILGLESSHALASFYGFQEILENRILTPKQICGKIDKVGAKDILEVSQCIFKPENLNLAVIGPIEDKNKLQGTLII